MVDLVQKSAKLSILVARGEVSATELRRLTLAIRTEHRRAACPAVPESR